MYTLYPECILISLPVNAFDLSSSRKANVSVYNKYTSPDHHFDLSAKKQLEARDVVSWPDVTSQGLALNSHGTVARMDPV